MARVRNYLFLHQNMPGQFLHLCRYLRDRGNRVAFITQNKPNQLARVTKVLYEPHRSTAPQTHHYLHSTEGGILNGQAVHRSILNLRNGGFSPDIVIGHCGWGETLFVKEALPEVPLLTFFEFYYRHKGQDFAFDPEYAPTPDATVGLRIKNTINLQSLDACDRGLTPTLWQLSGYPEAFRSKISVIHDGVDTQAIRPDPSASLVLPSGRVLKAGDKVVTYVARNLEPYRGFHVFMRALPELRRRNPDADIVIVGGEGVSYGQRLPEGDSYKKRLLQEVSVDPERVHFLGHLPTEHYRAVLQVSAVHIYLTYPFVLSWSMIEAMASGCVVVGSRTPPVEEVITNGSNGLLVDFFDQSGLVDRISAALAHPQDFAGLREAARQTAIARYDLSTVSLPRQLALIDDMTR